MSWSVSVSQINYFPNRKAELKNRSARHWQITIFCSTSSSNCFLIFFFFSTVPFVYLRHLALSYHYAGTILLCDRTCIGPFDKYRFGSLRSLRVVAKEELSWASMVKRNWSRSTWHYQLELKWLYINENHYGNFIIWLCLTSTGNYHIHEFVWLKSILEVV